MISRSSALAAGVLVSCIVLCGGAVVSAQETTAPAAATAAPKPAQAPRPRYTPLKVQLVVARYLGEKKVSSLPYLLSVTADDQVTTNLRMGVDVPVSTSVFSSGESKSTPVQSYSYRNVGTSIDCNAMSIDASYKVTITLSDSAIQFDPKQEPGAKTRLADAPAFRTFTSKFSILLRDGQTTQYTAATDPISGEVLRVDVTLNVVK